MATLHEDRLQALRERLEATGSVVVSEVAKELGVSEMTVRRDLRRLEEQGQVARVHGGAVAGGQLTFSHRLAQHGQAKKRPPIN